MNGMLLLLIVLVYFALAYVIYGRFICKRFGVDSKKSCPSHTMEDGVDYVPTSPAVLFGHHFASIAGAGPIIGPIVAAYFGWVPVLLWILIGCVFIGAMHDFSAMFLSIRNQGRSIAYAIEKELGYLGRQIFLFFCWTTLLLVVAVFTMNVADGFLSNPAVATSSILFILMAPLFGIAVNRKILGLLEASLVFVPLLFFCSWLGTVIPFDLATIVGSKVAARNIWILALLYYAAIASIIPVWVLLQPRDYLNSYLLYAMMAIGIIGVCFAKPTIQLDALHVTAEKGFIPNVMPLLFVTVACGACSGFHALVSSGTSSKQIDNEKHILPVAYGGMLIEGVLALLATLSIAYLSNTDAIAVLSGPEKQPPAIIFASGLAHFAEKVGISYKVGFNFISLSISAFLLTSLDTATRLGRFIWQELVMPRADAAKTPVQTNVAKPAPAPKISFYDVIGNRWTSTLLIVVIGGFLALSGEGNDIWPVFGASNQLLAALTLLAVTLWLLRKKVKALFAMLPMIFMLVISIWALICLIIQKWGKSWTLVAISVILVCVAVFLLGLGAKTIFAKQKQASTKQ